MGWRYSTAEGVHDDDTRQVWDETTTPAVVVRDYTETEDAAADGRQSRRAEQDARLSDLAARVARIEARLWPAPPDPTDPDDPTVTDWEGVWPDGGLLRDGGTVWRNVSGVPLTTPPSGFPGMASQWDRLFVAVLTPEPEPDPEPTVAPWSALTRYKIGDRCTRGGRLYECKVAHGAEYAGTWGPPAAGVWKDIGPA